MNYSENAINVFKKLYFKRDKNDNLVENHPDEVFTRVANIVSSAHGENNELQNKFYIMMQSGKFRPCTPCLMNTGVKKNPQTAACFVGDLCDDLISIFSFDKESGIIFSKGSGVGANFGVLREMDAPLSSGGCSSGPLSFLKKWAATAEAVKSGGNSRRAAELSMFFDTHPDLLEFITIKTNEDQKELRSMNLSVAISNTFMEAVQNDEMWELIGVVDKKVKSTHKARDIFNLIADNAYKTGDPGIWYIDHANLDNGLQRQYGRVISTNPCFSKDTLITTSKGAFPIIDLVGKKVTIFDGENWVETDSFRKTGVDQKLLRIYINDSFHIDVTPYHTMYFNKGIRHIKAGNIEIGDVLYSNLTENAIVTNIELLQDKHDVYCCTIPTTHKVLTASGIITGNCGEISGLPSSACALASINLTKFVKGNGFDFDLFKENVKYGTYFLDFMIDISGYPADSYKLMAQNTRPLGLGIMGLADMLCLLDIPYDSEEAYKLCGDITLTMTQTAIKTSVELAEKYGSFKDFKNNESEMAAVSNNFGINLQTPQKLRNSQWTTIAPTGTISISADCSPGMEPLFGITYTKNISDSDEKWIFVNPVFENKYKNEFWYKEAIEKIEKNRGSCQGIKCVPEKVQKVWKVAHDIHWKDRIEMQSYLQRGISNSISSTANLSNSATVDEIKEIYMLAWKKGLKGITVYRDGSKIDQPVEFSKEIIKEVIEERPKVREGKTHEVFTGHGKIYVTVNHDINGKVLEIFTNGGKNGGVSAANLEAIARLASLALQQGVSVDDIAHTLLGISDGTVSWDKLSIGDVKATQITSIPDAIAQILHRFYVKPDGVTEVETIKLEDEIRCPDCGGFATLSEGCIFCPRCGSKCG